MHLCALANGPFVHAIGWTSGCGYTAHARRAGQWQELEARLRFKSSDSVEFVGPEGEPWSQLAEPLSTAYLRESRVPRAKSAAVSTVFASTLAQKLFSVLSAAECVEGDAVGLAVASTTSIHQIFWRFESVGVAGSWQKTDTTLLPASIPSSAVTACSMVTGAHACAVSLGDGAFGMLAGIELAHSCFQHARARQFMVIGADEVCAVTLQSRDKAGAGTLPLLDGAAGIGLSRDRISDDDWRVVAVGAAPAGAELALDGSWQTAHRMRLSLPHGLLAYSACLLPHAIAQAISEAQGDLVLLEIECAGKGTGHLGLGRHA